MVTNQRLLEQFRQTLMPGSLEKMPFCGRPVTLVMKRTGSSSPLVHFGIHNLSP